MIKTIILLTAEIEKPYSFQRDYKEFYENLSIIGLNKNIKIISSGIFDYEEEKNIFNNGVYFDGKKWIEEKNIKADLVWCKANIDNYIIRLIEKNNKFLNPVDYISFSNDKYITSIFFKNESPKSFLLGGDESILSEINSNDLILKPNGGSGGNGVMKIKKTDLDKYKNGKYNNYLVQETLNLSDGIEGIVEGIHDIRFFIFGDKLGETILIRTPPKNDFRCNISEGGLGEYINISSIPKELLKFVERIFENINKRFGFIFGSIDIAKSNGKYFIIEFNSSPGIDAFKYNKILEKKYYEDIINLLKNY